MSSAAPEDDLLRSVALQDAETIRAARDRAEAELIRATLEASTDAILVTDGAGQLSAFNEKFVELWRLPRDTLDSMDHRRLLEWMVRQATDAAAFTSRVDEIYASPTTNMFDLVELEDGRAIERFSQVQYIDGRPAGRVWIYRDITDRQRAEAALRDETRILELLNHTGNAIASTLDLQTLVQAVTDAATQLSGASFGAFFYNTLDDQGASFLLHTLSGAPKEAFGTLANPRATPLFAPIFRGEAPVRCDDVRADPQYGQSEPYHGLPAGHPAVRSLLGVPVVSRGGEVIGGLFLGHPEPSMFTERTERLIVGVAAQAAVAIDNARLHDELRRTTEERERLFKAERAARSEADRVGRMKDEFLATLSHELRTPLGAILGWSHVLLTGQSSPADAKRALETIVRNANAQTQLIDDLLDMNRIIAGKVLLAVQPMDVCGVINAAVEAVKLSAEARGIRLSAILDSRSDPVSGDPQRLQQIVWNLLSNAIKFTPKNGKVEVILERADSHVEITVNDSGIGIEAAFLPHVFDRFRQADSSTTRPHAGLGLGLSIVKQLVELHGGSVRARSQGQDRGSTFIVSLPFAPVRSAAAAQLPAAPLGTGDFTYANTLLEGVKVLVVDDEPDSRELVKEVLGRCKAHVFTAGTADDGLLFVSEEKPDLIISDIGMPSKDGYQFIREVRNLSDAQGGRTPAIALTAFARSEDRTRAMVAGYQVHVAKPIEIPELIATVASLTGRTARDARGR